MHKRIVVVSGPSGAGKSTAARALEDLGYFVVDNLPPQLMETLINLSDSSGNELRQLAFVIDARDANFLSDFGDIYDRVARSGHDVQLLFLDCDDETLVRRFKETRRRHPLEDGSGVVSALERERALLEDIHNRADHTIVTKELSVHDLKRTVTERFSQMGSKTQQLTILSFGFKHGLPPELDLCFDVRFLPNPYFVETLRPQTGLDAPVRDFVLAQEDAQTFLDHVERLATFLVPRYAAEGKSYVTFAIGCTGGKHRSVALSEAFAERLLHNGIAARVVHRDVKKGR